MHSTLEARKNALPASSSGPATTSGKDGGLQPDVYRRIAIEPKRVSRHRRHTRERGRQNFVIGAARLRRPRPFRRRSPILLRQDHIQHDRDRPGVCHTLHQCAQYVPWPGPPAQPDQALLINLHQHHAAGLSAAVRPPGQQIAYLVVQARDELRADQKNSSYDRHHRSARRDNAPSSGLQWTITSTRRLRCSATPGRVFTSGSTSP